MFAAVLLLLADSDAQRVDALLDAYRKKTRYTACAADRREVDDTEIIVCARRTSRYRLPLRAESEGHAARADTAGKRAARAGNATDAGGIGSCSTVGAGGAAGCTKGVNVVAIGAALLGLVKPGE